MTGMRKAAGFTIMEILIAISILLVGIVGVISLFPVAIKVGGDAITDSLSANLARSVEESVRAAMKHRKVAYVRGGDRRHVLAYFVYEHDGVVDPKNRRISRDPVPADPSSVKTRGASQWGRDCVVLLPCDNSTAANPDSGYGGRNAADARQRAYRAGKVFVYPEGDPSESKSGGAPPNGNGDPGNADDDKDDYELDHSQREIVKLRKQELLPNEEWPLRVTKTFRFGPKVLGGRVGSKAEKEGHFVPFSKAKDLQDPYRLYSYAFAIRRAYEDANLAPTPRRFAPANDLFEVKVMVYRAFMPETQQSHPIYSTTFLVAR